MDQPYQILLSEIKLRLTALGVPSGVQSAILGLVECSSDPVAISRIRRREAQPVALTNGALARRFLKVSLARNELLDRKLMASGGPNMLLDLVSAEEEGRSVTVSSLCHASGEPPTTALRQIERMVQHRLVTRSPDARDRRAIIVKPMPETIKVVSHLLNSCRVPSTRAGAWSIGVPSLE